MLRVRVWLKGEIPSDPRRGDVSSACSPGIIKGNYYLIISSLIKRKAACLLEATLAWSEAWEVQSKGAKGTPIPWGAPWVGWPSHMCLPEVAQPLWASNTPALEIRALNLVLLVSAFRVSGSTPYLEHWFAPRARSGGSWRHLMATPASWWTPGTGSTDNNR